MNFSWRTVTQFIIVTMLLVSMMNGVFCQRQRPNGRRGGPRVGPSKDTCSTPSAKSGSCVPMIRCRRYWGRNMPDLTNSSCGEKEDSQRVCCPLAENDETTITPETRMDKRFSPTTSLPTTENLELINSTGRSWRSLSGAFPENCGQSAGALSRIVGGQDAALGAWPWMAAIYLVRRGIRSPECGGVLVTSSHVLTAAHCTVTARRGQSFSPRHFLVRLGDLNLESDSDGANPIEIKVQTIMRHERFSIRTFQNDIAVLTLQQSVDISNDISPICLPFNSFLGDDLAGRNGIAIGWGSGSYDGPAISHLQQVQLPIWRNEECREVFRRDVPITESNLCAGAGDKDACRGDSGGPLMLPDERGKYNLIGIISFGKRCAEPGIPGVFTRISTFLNWIDQNIG